MTRSRSPVVLAVLLALSACQVVRADGWKVQMQGVKSLGLTYAGRAITADDASVVWFNPASMTRLSKPWTITWGVPLVNYRLDYRDRGSTSLLGLPLTGPSTANGGRTAAVPHFYAVRNINSRLWSGFGFNAPFGLGSDYGEGWLGRYHATKTELTVFNINPSLAVRLSDRVSLGVGLDVQRSDARLANMIDFGSIGAAVGLPLAPQHHDGRIELNAADWAVGYDLSLAWGVHPNTRLGVTYRSEIDHTLRGTASFTVPAEAAALTAGGTMFRDSGASTVVPMPRELAVSALHELGAKWVVVGDVVWTDWSQFRELAVTFENAAQPVLAQDARFTDSLRAGIGVIYRATDRWKLRAGAGHETTPVPDETRTPRLPEGNNTGVGAGASFRLGERGELDLSFSHLIPHEAPIFLHDPAAGQLAGGVRWRLDILAASLTLRF